MTPDPELQQLYIIRAQVDLLISNRELGLSNVGPVECQHPEEKRVNTTTMGGPHKFECLECGAKDVVGVA